MAYGMCRLSLMAIICGMTGMTEQQARVSVITLNDHKSVKWTWSKVSIKVYSSVTIKDIKVTY